VRSGLLLSAVLLAAVFWARPWAAWLIVSAVAVLGLREFYRLLEAGGIPNFRIIGIACSLLLIAAAGLAPRMPPAWPDPTHAALFAGAVAVFARMLFQRGNPRPLETMAGTLMGLLYVGYMMSFFLRLAFLGGDGELSGRWSILYLVAVVKTGDMAAYFIGCRIGRHKLFPRVSPAKSWEGTIAGLVGAVAASLVARALLGGVLGPVRLPLGSAIVLGLGLGVVGLFGDLLESLMKRAAGMKDSGSLIAGMGGVLDVLDSLLPAAPLLYFYLRYWLLPVR